MKQIRDNLPPAFLSVADVIRATGLSRGSVYKEISAGSLRSIKFGRRRLVSPAALVEWTETLEREAAR